MNGRPWRGRHSAGAPGSAEQHPPPSLSARGGSLQYPAPSFFPLNSNFPNPNLYCHNAVSYFQSPNVYTSSFGNPCLQDYNVQYRPNRPSSNRQDVLERIESVVTEVKHGLLTAGESVSLWKVSQAVLLSLQVDSWTTLGFQFQEIPSLYRLMMTEGKVNAFVHCFVGVRRITSIHDLNVAICENEGIHNFEELGLGPLLRHSLVEHYFSVPTDMTEIFEITSEEIISYLAEFMDTCSNNEIKAETFLDFLTNHRSLSARERLGIRIQSLGMHITCIREARKSEKVALESYRRNTRHIFTDQNKEKDRESFRSHGTFSQKKVLDRRFDAMAERVKLFSTSQAFKGKHIRFDSSNSEGESSEDDAGSDKEHDNHAFYIQDQQSSGNMKDGEQRVSSCPYPSATEEILRLGIRSGMGAHATPGSGKSVAGVELSGKKRKSGTSCAGDMNSFKRKKDNNVLDRFSMKHESSSDSHRRKKIRDGSIEKPNTNYGSGSAREMDSLPGYPDRNNFDCLDLNGNDMENFIATWKDSCREHSITSVFYKMLRFYKPKRGKIRRLFQSHPCAGLLNVAVTSIKCGMWDNLYDTLQAFGDDKASTIQPTEVIDIGTAINRDAKGDQSELVPRTLSSITVDGIIRKMEAYFDLEHVTTTSQGNLPLARRIECVKTICDCEIWLTKQFAAIDFISLGHGDFFEFLRKYCALLPLNLHNILTSEERCKNLSLEVSIPQNLLLALLSQACSELYDILTITNQQISSLLKKQFPLISFQLAGGPVEGLLELVGKQLNADSSTCLLFSATLWGESTDDCSLVSHESHLGTYEKVTDLDKSVGCLGSVSSKDAIECLLKSPMLSDVLAWSHWDLIYAPSLGPFLEWFLSHGHKKDLLCILTRNGKIIRIDPTATVDSFLEASVQGSPYQTAVKLLSLLCLYRGTNHVPISLLKCYATQAFEVMMRNSVDGTEVKNKEEVPQQQMVLNVDIKDCPLPIESCGSLCTINKANNIVSRFFLDCLTYLPSEFRSFAADLFLAGLKSSMKNAPTVILHECYQTDQRFMLHNIGLSLGITEWIEDYRRCSSSTVCSLPMIMGSYREGQKPSTSSTSMQSKYGAENCITLLSMGDSMVVSKSEISSSDGNNGEEIHGSEFLSGMSCEKTVDSSGSFVSKNKQEQEAAHLIEVIRSEEFGLDPDHNSAESNLLRKQHARLGRALHCLSQELYSQDSHFLLELVQNADDNVYPQSVDPTLVFILQADSIVVLNNEQGFSCQNIRALCDVGNSTKKGSGTGYIGQKGIGFKSVFRVTDAPEIHSNGFHVKFDTSEGEIGFVLPTIISPYDISSFARQLSVEGDQTDVTCWNTCIVLPFRLKLKGVGISSIISMFSDLHPSLLLFLHRLRCIKFKNMINNSLTIMKRETVGNGIIKVSHGSEKMSWLLVRQKLHSGVVRPEVQMTEIAIAFTLEESNNGEYKPYLSQQPVFAFLPLRTYGLKFILQGDFVLPSSREEVDGNSVWNQWLLSEFPALFVTAEKSFCDLPCFQGSPGKSVTAYMSFVPLPGEVHGFFSTLPRMIMSKLRMSNCLLLEGPEMEWVPPCRVLRNWDKKAEILLPQGLLHQHLGLGFLNRDINISDPLAEALGIQEYGPKILIDIMSSICLTGSGIKSLGLDWLSAWLGAFFSTLSIHSSSRQVTEMECDLINNVKKLPCIPLLDGSFGALAEGPIWLPCDTTAIKLEHDHHPKDFPNLYAKLRTVNPELLTAATRDAYSTEETHADDIIRMLTRIGVQKLFAHELIKVHILPSMSTDVISKDASLMTEYLSFVMLHLQSACLSCQTERAHIILELQRNAIILTNHGYKCPVEEPIHFSRGFGNPVDIKKLIGDEDTLWHEVDTIYLNQQCTRSLSSGLRKWREFLQELGVTDFVQVVGVNKQVSGVTDTVSPNMTLVGGGCTFAEMVEDWESPELVHLLSTLSSEKCRESCKYLLEILDSMWDSYFNTKAIGFSVFKSKEDRTPFQSSFMKSIQNFKWVASTRDEELHYPRDLFYDCEEVRSILGDNASYAVPMVHSKALLNAIGFKSQVTLDDLMAALRQWKTSIVPFRASILHMSKFYTCIWNGILSSGRKQLDQFKSDFSIFIPLTSTSRHEEVVSGELLSPEEVYWHDPTGCVDKTKEFALKSSILNVPSSKVLVHLYPNLHDFFVNECGVHRIPPFRCYIQILLQLSGVALPSQSADVVFHVLLKWADDLKSGLVGSEEISYLKVIFQKVETTVLPTMQDRWVSLHSCYGLICWTDEDELWKQFKHLTNINFIHFGELSDERKETILTKISALMKAIGVPALSEVVSREAIFYGTEDSTEKASLINWILPYAQRYLYKLHPAKYSHLKQHIHETLSQLRVAVVEKLYYRYTIKGCGSTSNKRFDCSSVLQGNTLYVTRASDSHSIFLELSRLLFDGSVELYLANFLHMITTMAESGSSEEQTEFFIVYSQKIPKLPDEEILWSLSCSLPRLGDPTSQPSSSLVEKNLPKVKRNLGSSPNWPPTDWKTAPDFHFARANHFKTQPGATHTDGTKIKPHDPEAVMHTEWQIPADISGDWESPSWPAAVPPVLPDSSSRTKREDSLLVDHNVSSSKVNNLNLDVYSGFADPIITSDPVIGSSAFTTRDQLLLAMPNENQAHRTGRLGELVAYKYFVDKFGRAAVRWVNEENETGLPFDLVVGEEEEKEFIEVKATKSLNKDWFIITTREWHFASEKGDSFSVAHVVLADPKNAKITVFKNPVKLCQQDVLHLAVLMSKSCKEGSNT
ncbi:protein NO VEIN [Aristolochia californica]|uniref:protein NO VEIN n=1 Tax=Aristolochia californica TaxID=171875 RepID=UPI0035E1C9ED